MSRWKLTGTEAQIAIAREALQRIKFPFDRLTQLPGTPELGWRDLNHSDDWMREAKGSRFHGSNTHGKDRPDPLEVEHEGRRWTLGVIFTLSGRIFIDNSLTDEPERAMAVIGAEIAHAVDFFLPMTDEQRNELLRLWGVGGTWWEVEDYGREYFKLGGEAFMHEFVAAYSDLDFGSTGAFMHNAGVEPEDVRRILGIERTDAARFVRFGSSKVYHEREHRQRGKSRAEITDTTGLRPCKVCKPGAA